MTETIFVLHSAIFEDMYFGSMTQSGYAHKPYPCYWIISTHIMTMKRIICMAAPSLKLHSNIPVLNGTGGSAFEIHTWIANQFHRQNAPNKKASWLQISVYISVRCDLAASVCGLAASLR